MLTLDFVILKDSEYDIRNWKNPTWSILEYNCFQGDVYLRTETADLSTDWGWVSVIAFARDLRHIAGSLTGDRREVFEFPDSEFTIEFVGRGGHVDIRGDYTDGVITVDTNEFVTAAKAMFRRFRRYAEGAHPDLRENREYVQYLGAYWDEDID